MARNQKSYTREFKIEAVRLLETTGKSQSQIERELGIGSTNLSRWKREFGECQLSPVIGPLVFGQAGPLVRMTLHAKLLSADDAQDACATTA